MTTYKVELANKYGKNGAIGNLYGVGRYVNGCRHGYALPPQESRELAHTFADNANRAIRIQVRRNAFVIINDRRERWNSNRSSRMPRLTLIHARKRTERLGAIPATYAYDASKPVATAYTRVLASV